MLGPCKPGTGEKNQVRKSIGDGAADHSNHGFPQICGEKSEGGNSGPTQGIAQPHENQASDHPRGKLSPESPNIDLLRQGRPDKLRFGKAGGDISDHRDRRFCDTVYRLTRIFGKCRSCSCQVQKITR